MKLTGHKTLAMFMHYVHTEDKPVRAAAKLMANLLGCGCSTLVLVPTLV